MKKVKIKITRYLARLCEFIKEMFFPKKRFKGGSLKKIKDNRNIDNILFSIDFIKFII